MALLPKQIIKNEWQQNVDQTLPSVKSSTVLSDMSRPIVSLPAYLSLSFASIVAAGVYKSYISPIKQGQLQAQMMEQVHSSKDALAYLGVPVSFRDFKVDEGEEVAEGKESQKSSMVAAGSKKEGMVCCDRWKMDGDWSKPSCSVRSEGVEMVLRGLDVNASVEEIVPEKDDMFWWKAVVMVGVGAAVGVSIATFARKQIAHRGSKVYELAIEKFEAHPKTKELLGLPLKKESKKADFSGVLKPTMADYKLVCHGSQRRGVLSVQANRKDNDAAWKFKRLMLEVDGMPRPINLLR